jgi:anaerobic ribonucleoside-triphosphate reductase
MRELLSDSLCALSANTSTSIMLRTSSLIVCSFCSFAYAGFVSVLGYLCAACSQRMAVAAGILRAGK